MATISETRKALGFANELRLLLSQKNPPIKVQSWVHKLAAKIQTVYGTTPEYKKQMVLQWLKTEASGDPVSCQDVADHFGWPRQTAGELLKSMASEGLIVEVKERSVNGKGRPAMRYRMISAPLAP